MAVIQRHWLSMVLSGLIVLLACSWLIIPQVIAPQARAQTAPAPAGAVDEVTYYAVRDLRQQLALTSADLAALGCTEPAAELVLQRLKSWYQTNEAALRQARQDELTARRNLREAMRKIHVGPRNDLVMNQVPGLRQALTTAVAQRKQLVESVIPVVGVQFSATQNDVWSAARANAGIPSYFRYAPNLADFQRQEIRRYLMKRRADGSATQLAAAEVLNVSQRQAIDSAQMNAALHMQGVFDAETAVLPVPAALRTDFDEDLVEPLP